MTYPFYYLIGVVSWPVVRLLFRLRARGQENLPTEGGFILASNHLSNFDPWAVGMALWPRYRLRWMAKAEVFRFVLKPILLHGGAFPVRRGEQDMGAIRTAIRAVRDGYVLVMFPEGTRRRKGLRKTRQPRPHTGTARIALSAGVPLVPAAISGTDRLARFGPLRVVYGPPVPVDDVRGDDAKQAAEVVTGRLMDAIAELEATL